mgnify:CR=1 FL=1
MLTLLSGQKNLTSKSRDTIVAALHQWQKISAFLILFVAVMLGLVALPTPNASAATTCQAQYLVQPGDTLAKIGQRYNVLWTSIAQANNLSNPNRIYVGQKLCIPSSSNQPPPATPPPTGTVPTIKVVSVTANQAVTISTANFPSNQKFDVLMGAYGTKGINGTWVTSINSGAGGTFSTTFSIPTAWHGADRIAIRLQNASGYYSFNWFHNTTTK